MEFRQLIIAQKDSSARYIFNRKVNLVTSTELSDELLKANYDLENSSYFYEFSKLKSELLQPES